MKETKDITRKNFEVTKYRVKIHIKISEKDI